MNKINVIGAGLAGCEAAWQAARRGMAVRLIEMKPKKKTPAHTSDLFGELVCSNSLRNAEVASAAGLLKEELRRMGSLMMEAADALEFERAAYLRDQIKKLTSATDAAPVLKS